MIEAEWLACTDPHLMLEYLRSKPIDRKLRLFAVACCRKCWDLLADERGRVAVETAERFADGQAALSDLNYAKVAAQSLHKVVHTPNDAAVMAAVLSTASTDVLDVSLVISCVVASHATISFHNRPPSSSKTLEGFYQDEREWHAEQMRDIFGNPFRRPVPISPSWLEWRDRTVVRLAQSIYEGRGFDHLPVLADALEEAGCHDAQILGHCRQPGPHVRGCWVVDLILGRK